MDVETLDALCQRCCAFALYREQGGEDVFCMQKDGGIRPEWKGEGFVLAGYHAAPHLIAAECTALPDPARYAPLPRRTPRTPATTREEYHRLFTQYTQWLQGENALGKIVLARTQDIPCAAPSPARLYAAACQSAPGEFQALVHTPDAGTWLCSTPELLLKGGNGTWQTMALAGTRRLSPEPWDPKNTAEQRMVTDSIGQTLTRFGCPWETEATTNRIAGEIEHLCTRIRFRHPASGLPRLLEELQPTPAVCGYPRAAALERIATHPDIERGLYTGYMGRWNPQNAALYVTLRCMQIFPDRCRLYAGGGLLPTSDEEAEWQETTWKMQPMLRLLTATNAPL